MLEGALCQMCMKRISLTAKICPWCHTITSYGQRCAADPTLDSRLNKIAGWTVAILLALMGACYIAINQGDHGDQEAASGADQATVPSTDKSADQEWYSGGLSSSASMSEWTVASDRDQLATSADIATAALKLKYGSLHAAMQKLGTMENLRPYAIAVQTCMNTAVKRPPETTEESWRKVLQKQTVRDFGVGCLAELKVEGGVGF